MHLITPLVFFPSACHALAGFAVAQPHTTQPPIVTLTVGDGTPLYRRASPLNERQEGSCLLGLVPCGTGTNRSWVGDVHSDDSDDSYSTIFDSFNADFFCTTIIIVNISINKRSIDLAIRHVGNSFDRNSTIAGPIPGAVAGIAVGSALGGIAVSLASVYYFVYRRRFTKSGRVQQQKIGDDGEENPFARKELDRKGILGVVEIAGGSPPPGGIGWPGSPCAAV
ncbi:hypothetical protein VTI28DRAFT_8100 [Corynascus sepedonium]